VAGFELEPIWASLLAKALEGKNVKDLLSNVGAGGSGPAVGGGAAAGGGGAAAEAAPAEEEKKEEEKEESDDDMVCESSVRPRDFLIGCRASVSSTDHIPYPYFFCRMHTVVFSCHIISSSQICCDMRSEIDQVYHPMAQSQKRIVGQSYYDTKLTTSFAHLPVNDAPGRSTSDVRSVAIVACTILEQGSSFRIFDSSFALYSASLFTLSSQNSVL